jgi:FkbM family methyltransferase
MIINFLKKISHSRLFFFKKFYKSILLKNKITFIDVGASIQIIPRWKKIDKKNLNYILFEPNKIEVPFLKLNKIHYDKYTIYTSALGKKKENLELNITKGSYQSSVLKPNFDFINQFPDSGRFGIVKKTKIKTRTLDTFKIMNADFIKVDAQGYDYEVLQGSIKTLSNTIGIEVEVEFIDMYQKQKLFGDIHKILIDNSFLFIDFLSLQKWHRNARDGGQCVFGNALYLKKFECISNMNKKKVLKYISICLLYNKFDMAAEAVQKYKFKNSEKKIINEKIKFLEKKFCKSKLIKKIANGIIKFFDMDQNLYLFQ